MAQVGSVKEMSGEKLDYQNIDYSDDSRGM